MISRLFDRILTFSFLVVTIPIYLSIGLYYLPRTVPAEGKVDEALQNGNIVTRVFDIQSLYPHYGTKHELITRFSASHFILHFQVIQQRDASRVLRVSADASRPRSHQHAEARHMQLAERTTSKIEGQRDTHFIPYLPPLVSALDIPLHARDEIGLYGPIVLEAGVTNLFDTIQQVWPPTGDSALLYWWFTRRTVAFAISIRTATTENGMVLELWPSFWPIQFNASVDFPYGPQPLLAVKTIRNSHSLAGDPQFTFPTSPASHSKTSFYPFRLILCLVIAPFAIALWLLSYVMFEYPIIPRLIRLGISVMGGIPALFLVGILCGYGRLLWLGRGEVAVQISNLDELVNDLDQKP